MLISLEQNVSNYLRQVTPPKTDFSIALSIARKDDGTNVSAEVTIWGRPGSLENYSRFAEDAVNYIRKKLVEFLESRSSTSRDF